MTGHGWSRPLLRVAGLLIGLALVGCGDNQPPSMGLIDDQVVSVGDQLRVELLGQDPDGDVLGWGLVGLGAGAEIVPQTASTALLLWSPALSDTEPGGKVYQATVTAADGRGGDLIAEPHGGERDEQEVASVEHVLENAVVVEAGLGHEQRGGEDSEAHEQNHQGEAQRGDGVLHRRREHL